MGVLSAMLAWLHTGIIRECGDGLLLYASLKVTSCSTSQTCILYTHEHSYSFIGKMWLLKVCHPSKSNWYCLCVQMTNKCHPLVHPVFFHIYLWYIGVSRCQVWLFFDGDLTSLMFYFMTREKPRGCSAKIHREDQSGAR